MGTVTFTMAGTCGVKQHLHRLHEENKRKRELKEALERRPSQQQLKEKQEKEKGFNLCLNIVPLRRVAQSNGGSPERRKWKLDGSSIHIRGEKGEDHRLLPRWARHDAVVGSRTADSEANSSLSSFEVKQEEDDDAESVQHKRSHGSSGMGSDEEQGDQGGCAMEGTKELSTPSWLRADELPPPCYDPPNDPFSPRRELIRSSEASLQDEHGSAEISATLSTDAAEAPPTWFQALQQEGSPNASPTETPPIKGLRTRRREHAEAFSVGLGDLPVNRVLWSPTAGKQIVRAEDGGSRCHTPNTGRAVSACNF